MAEQDLLNRIGRLEMRVIELGQRLRKHRHEGLESEKLNDGVFFIPVSYESNEIADIDFYVPFGIRIVKVGGRTIKAIAATDDATTTVKNDNGDTMATITFAAGTAIDTDATDQQPSENNAIGKDMKFTLTQAKSTAGGKAIISIEYVRL
jgi:hypothetical protein